MPTERMMPMQTERMMPMQTERMMPAQTVHGGMGNGGHLYIQTDRVPDAAGRFAGGDHQRRDPVQQLAGVGELLIPFNGESQYQP
jgi:hypothetical protein